MTLDGGTVVIEVVGKYKNQLSPGIDNADKQVDKFDQSLQKIQRDLDKLGSKKTDVGVNDKATNSLTKIMQGIKQFSGKTFKATVRILDYATAPLRGIKNALFSVKGLVAAVAGGAAVNAGIMQPIQMADTIENAKIGFETLLGDAELAAKKMDEIKQFAAKTPFDTMGVVSNVQQMLNSGWDVNKVMSDMEIIGNAASATGNSTEGFSRIITAINQMRMSGKVNAQDMMQLTNANLPGWMLMAEGLGMTVQELREATRKGTIDAEQGIAGLMAGLRKYDGMMEQISTRTVTGLWSNIKDTFNIKVIERWGQGLKDGALDAFIKLADVLDVIDPHLEALGDFLYDTGNYLSGKFAVAVDNSLQRLVKLLDSEEFKNADIFGKIGLAWDKLIAEPFGKWWNSTGKEFIEGKAGEIGKGIGTGVKNGLLWLLGIDAAGATEDGLDIGKSFCEGFIDGIDTDAIKDALAKAFKEAALDSLKILPGGDSPTTSSWVSAIALGFLGKKLGLGKLFGKAGDKLLSSFTGKGNLAAGVSTVANGADDYAAWWSNQKLWKLNSRGSVIAENQELWRNGTKVANATANASSKFSGLKNLASDKVVQGVSKMLSVFGSGGKLSKLTSAGSKLGKFVKGNWLSLLFSAAAIASSDDKVGTTIEQGGGLAGSAAGGALGGKAGAAIGTFIAGPPGTAIGGGIGSILGSVLGYMGGEWGAGELWDKAKSWWGGDYDPEKGIFAGGGKDFFKQWWGSTKKNATDNIDMAKGSWKNLKNWFMGDYDEDEGIFSGGVVGFFKEWGGSIKENFEGLTGNLKESWDNAVEDFKGIPETISTSFGNAWGNVCAGVEEDFADLSVWWEDTMEVINTFFNETLPEWWNEKVALVETFFTETLPGWFEEAVNSFVSYWTVDVPAYWNGKADEIASGWGDVKQYFKDKADELVGWFNEKKEEVKTAWEGSTVKKGIDTGVSWVKEKLGIESEHATGGIFSRPHVGLVAEDGPEAIIPLGAKRRQRGLDLWLRAGAAMGVTPYANGGIVGNLGKLAGGAIGTMFGPAGTIAGSHIGGLLAEKAQEFVVDNLFGNATVQQPITIEGVTVNISVDGGSGTLVEALNSQSEEIKEAIAGILYSALSSSFNNMPITT